MSTLQEGLNAGFSLSGTALALLSEVAYEHHSDAKPWADLGSAVVTDILFGLETYKCTAKHGYVDNTFQNHQKNHTVFAGSIFPRGGTTPVLYGSALITSTKISGMQHQSSDPVLEDIEFMMYAVTHN